MCPAVVGVGITVVPVAAPESFHCGDRSRDRLRAGQFADADRGEVEVGRTDGQPQHVLDEVAIGRRQQRIFRAAGGGEVVEESGVIGQARADRPVRIDVAAAEVERIGWRDPVFLDHVLSGGGHQRRTHLCRTPVRVRFDDQRAEAGDVRRGHRGPLQVLERLALSAEDRLGRMTREDTHTRRGDVRLDPVGFGPVRAARGEAGHDVAVEHFGDEVAGG